MHCSKEESLASNQDEADAKVFLCSPHAGDLGQQNVCSITVDSDIAMYSLYFESILSVIQYLRIGSGNRTRVLDTSKIESEIGLDCCTTLPALHIFTGSDYTSTFHSMGSVKPFKAMKSSAEYLSAFKVFGNSFTFKTNLFVL